MSGGGKSIALVMVLSLAAAGVTRDLAVGQRGGEPAVTGNASLGGMNSYLLALLLGGLRGPLVMYLWPSIESQKQQHDLQDLDTKVEWVRRLQPEFDSVHIFQMWNKAYNVSVLMATRSNRYVTVLDALEYGHEVDRIKPDDINIVSSMGQIYEDKLGDANPEKTYYRRRVRQETMARAAEASSSPNWRRTRLDPMLDAQGHILPALLAPRHPRPGNLPADAEWNDGSELQYLKTYEPFPNGISPFALAYNYQKRAEVMQNVDKQKHVQLPEQVVDSRPAVALRKWAEEEWDRGRRLEIEAFEQSAPSEGPALEASTARQPPEGTVPQPGQLADAIRIYALTARLCGDSLVEYGRCLRDFPINEYIYRSTMDELTARKEMMGADQDYLLAIGAPPSQRRDLLARAKTGYQTAADDYRILILGYFTPDDLVPQIFPAGLHRWDMQKVPRADLPKMIEKLVELMKSRPYDENRDVREGHLSIVRRAEARLEHLRGE